MEEDTRGNGYPTGQEGTKGNGYQATEQEDVQGSSYPTEQEDARGSGYPTEQEGSSETQDTIDKALIDLLTLAKILKEKISHQKMPHTKSDQQVSSGTSYSCRSHQQTKSAPAGRSVSRDVHPAGSTVGRTSETQISPDSLHKSPMKKKIHSGNYPCHICWKHGIHPSSVHNQREGIEQLRRTQSQHRKQTHSSTHKMEPNPRDRPGDTVNPSIVHHRDRPGDTVNHCQKAYTSVSPAAPKASNESATNHNSSALQIRDTQHIPSVPSQTYDSQPGKYQHLEVQATSVKPVMTNRQESTVKQSEMTDGADNMHTSNSQSKSVNVDKKLDGRPISEFSQVQSTKSGYKLTANDSQRYSTSYNSTSHKTQTSPKLTTEQMHISHPQQSPQSLTAHGKEYGNSMHKNQHSKSTTQKAAANDNTSHKTNNSQCREKTHTKSHHSISKVSVTNPSSKNEEISRSGKLKSSSSAKCLEPLKIPSSAQKKCENSISAQYPPGIQKTLEAIASKLTMINADCRAASSSGKSSFKSKAKNSLQVKSTERKSITDLIDEVKSTKLHQKDKKSQSCTQERSRSRDKDSVNVQTDANSSKDASHVGSNRQENKVNLKKSKEDVPGKESSKRKSSNKVSFENHVNSSENQLKKSEIQDHHQNSTLHKNNKTQDQNLSIEDLGLDEDLPLLVRSRRYSDKQRQTHHKTHTPESETRKHSTDSVHTGNNENKEIHHNVNDVVKVGDIATAEHKDTRTIESKHQSSQEKLAMQEDNSNKIDEKLDVNHKASGKDEQNFENASDCIEAGICCKFLNFLSRSQSIKNIPSESMCDGAKTNPDNTKHSNLSAKRQKHIQGTTEIREKGIGYHINETDVKGQESDKNSAINKSQTNIGESSAEDVNKHINLILTNIKKEPEWNISPSESLNHKTNETRSESQSQKKDSGRNIWEDLRLQQDQRLHHEPGSKQLLQHTTEETIQTPGENPTKEKMQIKEPKKSNSGEVQLTWQQLMKPIPESPQTERKPTLKSIIKTEPVSPAIPTSNHAPSLRNETESGEQNTFIKTEPVSPTILTDNHYQSLTNGKQSGQQSRNITQLDNLQGGKDEHKSDDADRLQENTQTKESMYKQNQDKNIQKSNKQTEEVKIQNVNAKQTPENDMNHAAESDSIPHNSTEVPTHTEIQQPNSIQVNKDNTKETDTTSRDKNISTQASPNESASETIICKDTKNVLITPCSGDKESEYILQTGNNLNEQQIEVKREVNPSADPFPVSDFGKSSKDSTVIKPQISPIRPIPDMQGIENGDKAVDPGESKNSNEESSSTCNIVQGDRKDETSTCNIVQGDRKDETKKKASTDQQRYLKSSTFCQSEEKSPMIRKTTANKRIVMLKSTFLPQFSSNQFKNPSVSNSTDEINNPNIKRNESNSTACKHIVQSEKKKKKSISSIVVSVNANKTVRKTTKQTREQSVARQIVKKRIASTPARSLKSSSIGSKRLLQQNTRTMTSREKEISIKSFKKEIKHKSRDSERNLKNTDETFGNRSSIRDNERGTRQSNTVCSCLRCTCERRELGQSQRYSDRYREKSPDDKYRRYWPRFTSPDRNNYNRDDYWTHETRVYERYPRRESSPPLPSSSGERESWNSRYDVYRRDRFLYHRSQSTAYIGRSPRTPSPPYQWTPPSSRSRSPPHRLRSPLPRSRSPIYRSASPKRRSRSPMLRSRSPKPRSRSPLPKCRSPIYRSVSPKRRSRSPKLRSRSPKRKSKSPVYRGYVAPRSKSLSSWPPEPQWSSFSSDSTVLNFKDRKKTEPSTVRSESNSMSTKKIRQDTLTTAKPSKPSNKSQTQTPTQNNLNNPLSKNSTVTGKMEDVKETEIMAKVSSSSSTCDASTDSDKIIANSLNRANQLQTIQVKMDHSRRLSNLIQIDTSSFEVGNKTVNTLSKPNQSNTSRTDTKGEDLKSNNILKMTENTRQKTANDTQTLGVSDKIKDTADVLQNTNKISEVDLEKRTDIKEVTKVTDTEKPKVKNIERQNSEQNLKDEKKKIFSIPDKQSSEQMEYGKPQNISDENKEKSTEMTKEIKNDVSATVNLVPMMKMGKVPVDFVMQESSNKVKKIMAMENMAINVESETKHTVVKATEHALNETQAVEPETTSDALHTGDKNGNVDSKIKGHAQDAKEATDQQPQNKLENKTPLKNNNKEVKDEKPNVNSKSPTTPPNQYIDINLKNMTHIYASDGQQVCNAFNMSKISGSDCPGTCNQHHLSLPLYNSYTKTDMSVSQTEEIEVLRDAKGNACFFNMSQKMICNNFNSDDGCKNKNCFMVHLSFYNIFYSYFRRKLKCQTSPTCVERGHKSLPGTNAASHTDNKLCKPVMEAAIQCEEQVEKTSIHKKDQSKEKSQYTSVEKCCMENQTSVNEDSTKRFQKDLSTHHQADKGGKQEPGKPTTSKNEPTKPENSDNNQTDLLKTEQSISSDPKTYDPTCKGNARDIERTSHSMTISGEYKDDMVTVINVKTVRRYPVCKFFNTPRGCQRWNCRYQHVKNKTKYHSKQKHNTYSPNFIWSNRKRQQNTFLAAGQKQPEKMKKFDIQPRKLNEQKCEKTSAQEPAICKNTESQEKKLNSKADQESGINNQNKIIPCAERNVSTPREAPNLSENSGKIGTEYGMNEKERSNQNTTGDERKTKDTTAISTVTENKVTKYTKSAPTSIKRKQDYDMPHRAAKIPRQNRDFNWQALLARQHSTLNHNNYNYHQANTTLASEQNNMAERWRPDMAERLCPDFNTAWGCRYPHWACSYIHDYADDVQF